MFERNPVDNSTLVTVAVEITMTDGSVVTGRAGLPPTRQVHKLLEGPDAFLFIETFEGEQTFVPKGTIAGIKLVNPVRPQALRLAAADATAFDPYAVLGIAKGTAFDDVRAAYHRLTKLYHPDATAGVTLPPEVRTYMDARAKQINAAFRLLKSPRRAAVLDT
jgi:DnaJ domain